MVTAYYRDGYRWGFPGGSVLKNPPAKQDPWVWKIWRRKWQATPVFLAGKSYGQRSLAGYCPWNCKGVRHSLETKQQR